MGPVSYFHHFLPFPGCISVFISPTFYSPSFFMIFPLVIFISQVWQSMIHSHGKYPYQAYSWHIPKHYPLWICSESIVFFVCFVLFLPFCISCRFVTLTILLSLYFTACTWCLLALPQNTTLFWCLEKYQNQLFILTNVFSFPDLQETFSYFYNWY